MAYIGFLSDPDTPPDEQARSYLFLCRSLDLILLLLTALAITAPLVAPSASAFAGLPAIIGTFGFVLVVRLLLTPQRTRFIAVLIYGVLWAVLTVEAFRIGGSRYSNFGSYILLLVTAGIVLGRWGWQVFTVLGLLGWTLQMLLTPSHGLLTPVTNFEEWIFGALQIAVSAAFISPVLLELKRISHHTREAEQRAIQQRDQAQMLSDLTCALASTIETDTLLDSIIEQIMLIVQIKSINIALVEQDMIRVRRQRGYDLLGTGYLDTLQHALGISELDRDALETAKPIIIQNVLFDRRWKVIPGTDWIRSYACFPLALQGQIIGLIRMDAAKYFAFPEDLVTRLNPLIGAAAIALGNARLYEQAQREIAERKRTQRALEESQADLHGFTIELENHIVERTQRLIESMERLQQSEERYRLLAETVTDLISRHTPSGDYVYASSASQRLLGYTPEELIGRSAYDYVHPEDVVELGRAYLLFAHKTDTAISTYRIRRADGRYIWFETVSRAVRDASGAIDYIICASRDITYRRLSEAIIERSEANLRAVLDSTDQAFILIDGQFTIRMVNRMAQELAQRFGGAELYPGASILDASPTDRLRVGFIVNFERALAGEIVSTELPYLHRGEMYYFELSYTPVLTNSGNVLGVCFVINNVTRRYQAQAELKAARDQLQAIVDNAPMAVYIKNIEGRYVMTNRHYRMILGLPNPESITSHTDEDFYPAAIVAQRDQYLKAVFATGQTVEEQEILPASDGTPHTYIAIKFPLRDRNGDITALCGMMVDITEIKRAEVELRHALQREQHLNELKSRFVAITSHEFRTPLATIQALTDTLNLYFDRLDPENRAKRFQRIQEQIRHMTGLLDNVLALSRFEEGYEELTLERFDVVSDIAALTDQFAQKVKDHPIDLQAEQAQLCVEADKRLLGSAVVNLLSNAAKFSPAGSPITVRVAQDGDTAFISVSDQGMGIPEQDLPHIFEAFHRAANVGTIQGTGLGLAIAKRAVEHHKGTLDVVSKLGVGTTFIIRLPRQHSTPPAEPALGLIRQGE